MKKVRVSFFGRIFLAIFFTSLTLSSDAGGLARLMYDRLGGNEVATLKGSARFPLRPSRVEFITIALKENEEPLPSTDPLVLTHPLGTFTITGLNTYDEYPERRQLAGVTVAGNAVTIPPPVGPIVYPFPIGFNLGVLPNAYTDNGADNYGSFMRGYLEAPMTGNYVFYIWSDDGAEVWLSEDHTPEKKKLIAEERGCCNAWGPRSHAVFLQKAKKYYLEVLHKEGGGGDYIRVGWLMPDGTFERPISGIHLMPFPLNIPVDPPQSNITVPQDFPVKPTETLEGAADFYPEYTPRQTGPVFVGVGSPLVGPAYYGFTGSGQPQSVQVAEGQPAILSTIVEATQPVEFQWFRDDVALPGETLSYLKIDRASAAQNGSRYTVRAKNHLGEVVSQPATIVAVPDLTPATVTQVLTRGQSKGVFIQFSEPVDAASASDSSRFTIDNGITVQKAIHRAPDWVELETSNEITSGRSYLLTINGVTDTAQSKNPTVSVVPFVQNDGFLTRREFHGTGGGVLVGDLTGHPKFTANQPDRVALQNTFEWPPNGGGFYMDQYGMQVQGFISVPVTGEYIFWLAADDQGYLYLSSDESPANKRLIGAEPVWGGPRGYLFPSPAVDDTRRHNRPEYGAGVFVNSSAVYAPPTVLEAGKRYYIEGIVKEGGGGDHIAVAWQKPGDRPVQNGDAPIGPAYISSFGVTKDPVKITTPLDDLTVVEFTDVTLSAEASGFPILRYQWLKNGTAIPGATNQTLRLTSLSRTESGAKIGVQVRNGFSSVLDEAVLTVTPVLQAPTALTAAAPKEMKQIGVTFNQVMDKTSAETVSNYQLDVSKTTIVGARLLEDGQRLHLELSQPLAADDVLKLTGIKNKAGAPVDSGASVPVRAISFTGQDIGTRFATLPIYPGSLFTSDGTNFQLIGGGSDIYGARDGFYSAFQEYEGNFDVSVRVSRLDFTHVSAKAGLMMRENLDAGSRHVMVNVRPTDGANDYEAIQREFENGGASYWPGFTPSPRPDYPNAWLRLMRRGDLFTGYRSNDGITWTQISSTTLAEVPSKVYLGLAVCGIDHNGANPLERPTLAEFHSWSVTEPPPLVGPKLTILQDDTRVFLSWEPSLEGTSYVLEETDDLSTNPIGWIQVDGTLDALFVEREITEGQRFYRLAPVE